MSENGRPLLEVRGLRKTFPVHSGIFGAHGEVVAVDNISFRIPRGTTLALVGESGSGKSTTARCVLRLLEPDAGEILFDGTDLAKLSLRRLRPYRERMQIVFQDPFSSLDPRMTVGQIVAEPLEVHSQRVGPKARAGRAARVAELLSLVGLSPDATHRYPHEFSGGQRQRIGIARALALEPDFLIADEPVSALDLSIRAQIINLLLDLQQRLSLTYLLIAHDLLLVKAFSDWVAVMYAGQIVEDGPTAEVYANPQHPYTQALLAASLEGRTKTMETRDLQLHRAALTACRFAPRCPRAQDICRTVEPQLAELHPSHRAACHFPGPDETVVTRPPD